MTEIKLAETTIIVERVGDNSLLGAVLDDLYKKGYLKSENNITFTKLIFIVKSVHPDVNLWEEARKVSAYLEIEPTKIIVNTQP